MNAILTFGNENHFYSCSLGESGGIAINKNSLDFHEIWQVDLSMSSDPDRSNSTGDVIDECIGLKVDDHENIYVLGTDRTFR